MSPLRFRTKTSKSSLNRAADTTTSISDLTTSFSFRSTDTLNKTGVKVKPPPLSVTIPQLQQTEPVGFVSQKPPNGFRRPLLKLRRNPSQSSFTFSNLFCRVRGGKGKEIDCPQTALPVLNDWSGSYPTTITEQVDSDEDNYSISRKLYHDTMSLQSHQDERDDWANLISNYFSNWMNTLDYPLPYSGNRSSEDHQRRDTSFGSILSSGSGPHIHRRRAQTVSGLSQLNPANISPKPSQPNARRAADFILPIQNNFHLAANLSPAVHLGQYDKNNIDDDTLSLLTVLDEQSCCTREEFCFPTWPTRAQIQ